MHNFRLPRLPQSSPFAKIITTFVMALILVGSTQFAAAQQVWRLFDGRYLEPDEGSDPLIHLPVSGGGGGVVPLAGSTYYYQSGSMNVTTNWTLNRDGTGGSAAFASANTYVIQNTQGGTANASWTSTTGPLNITIETGGSMDSGAFNPAVNLTMQTGASYAVSNTTYGALTTTSLNAGSTFTIGSTGTSLNGATYGNLIWNSTGNATPTDFTTGGSFTIQQSTIRGVAASSAVSHLWNIGTDINVTSGATFRLTDTSSTGNATFNIGGGLSNSSTISRAGTGTATFNFNGTGTSSATWGTNSGNFIVNVSSATKTITMSDSLNNGTGTVGVTGTFNLGNGSKLNGTGTITVNGGGTLLLSGAGSADRINDAAPITLASGGTFKLNGVSEGSTATAGVGALTLTSSGVIDLASTSLLHLAASGSQTWSGTLSIYNWSGSLSGGATEQLLFGTADNATSLTQAQLDAITFYSDSGTTSLGTAKFAGLGDGEVVPVPEPSTWIGGALAVGVVGWSQRRRFARLMKAKSPLVIG